MSGGGYGASFFSYGWKYDVFLSFRGSDTRHGFTGNLYNTLDRRGIRTFLDDKELLRGKEISQELINEIQHSRIAIPVFSQNYASSSFCLDELSTIIECLKDKGRLILPVFYGVDPSDVRHQRGSYGEALAKHEKKFKDDNEKVKKWRMALHQAANLSGEHFILGNEYEYVFIEKIVQVVSNKINREPLHIADYPVGLVSQALKVNLLLGDGSNEGVHMVGIYGIGGIGKTTLARAVYNLIADQFEGLCFLENVRENSTRHGLVHLQKTLLSDILEEDIKLASVNRGIPIIKHRLCRKKVLLILDDVDKRNQLKALVGGPDWFGSGSRVVITTRDKHLLTSHGIEATYEMDGLHKEDALELFCWNAFPNKQFDPNYKDIIKRAVTYACGLPLALEVIGSNLFGKSIQEWRSALDQYERIPNKEIQKILEVSFEGLEEEEQQIFLDIACFFQGFELNYVEEILCAHHGGCPKFIISVLVGKSLIKVTYDKVTLHDLIQDMGREIVRQKGKSGKFSRLWHHEDIVEVLEKNLGSCEIEIIFLDLPKSKEAVEWDGEAFKDMKSLRTLIIKNGCFSEGPKHLPNSLRVLEWWGYPSQSLPPGFHPEKLVILKLNNSCLTSLVPGKQKKLKLRVLKLDFTDCITEIPDVSELQTLEELSFHGCENLVKIDDSVGFLKKLKILDAKICKKLRSFPPIKLVSLEKLDLGHCYELRNFPEILAKMEKIRRVDTEYTAIEELPVSIGNLTYIGCLSVNVDGIYSRSPGKSAGSLTNVRIYLDSNAQRDNVFHVSVRNLSDESLSVFLARLTNIEVLKLSHLNFTILPECITELHSLRKLTLDYCPNLQEIRGIPPNLETLDASKCEFLKDLDLRVIHTGTKQYRFLSNLLVHHCEKVEEIRVILPHIKFFCVKNCTSLTYTCRNRLLNQELHEETGNMMLYMPGSVIPDWFEHRSTKGSISFWFRRRMFPAISLCVVIDFRFNNRVLWFRPSIKINGIRLYKWMEDQGLRPFICEHDREAYHIIIFNEKQMKLEDHVDEVLLENEWNHAEVSLEIFYSGTRYLDSKLETGLHIFKEKRGMDMEDIRFDDPYGSNDDNVNTE